MRGKAIWCAGTAAVGREPLEMPGTVYAIRAAQAKRTSSPHLRHCRARPFGPLCMDLPGWFFKMTGICWLILLPSDMRLTRTALTPSPYQGWALVAALPS